MVLPAPEGVAVTTISAGTPRVLVPATVRRVGATLADDWTSLVIAAAMAVWMV
jgi:hypothetical protein